MNAYYYGFIINNERYNFSDEVAELLGYEERHDCNYYFKEVTMNQLLSQLLEREDSFIRNCLLKLTSEYKLSNVIKKINTEKENCILWNNIKLYIGFNPIGYWDFNVDKRIISTITSSYNNLMQKADVLDFMQFEVGLVNENKRIFDDILDKLGLYSKYKFYKLIKTESDKFFYEYQIEA